MKKFKLKKRKSSPFPKVSHTKGYYRFSKEFPSVTDNDGYHDNSVIINSPAKKAAARRRLALVCAFIFLLSFCVTSLCLAVSNLPVAQTQEQATTADSDTEALSLSGYKMTTLSGDVLSYSSVESLLSQLKSESVNAVIIEFKDAQGYFYFKPSVKASAEALSKASDNAANVIKELKSEGITVFASISCFADDIYARNHQDYTAYVLSTPESGSTTQTKSIWYGGENGTNAWLSPYSSEVLYYLNTVISDINALGVECIVLENAVLPLSAESENVYFSLSDGFEASAREKMAQWVTYTNNNTSCDIAIVISQAQMLNFAAEENMNTCFSSGCDYIILDSRVSKAVNGTSISSKQYLEPTKTPKEYTSALLTLTADFLSSNELDAQIIPIIDGNDSTDAVISAIASLNNNKITSCITE